MRVKLIAVLIIIFSNVTFAGICLPAPTGVIMTPEKPQAGMAVTVTYLPTGKLAGAENVQAVLFQYYGSSFEGLAADLPVTGNKTTGWKISFRLHDSATAFCLSFKSNNITDDNDGKGYLYLAYNGNAPAAGAYAAAAEIYNSAERRMGLSENRYDTALQLYEREFALHPALKKDARLLRSYCTLLTMVRGTEAIYPIVEENTNRILSKRDLSEKDFMDIMSLYSMMPRSYSERKDSIELAGYHKYPKGEFTGAYYMRDEARKQYHNGGLEGYLTLYKRFRELFPSPKEGSEASFTDQMILADIIMGYAGEGKYDKAKEYIKQLKRYPEEYLLHEVWSYTEMATVLVEKKKDPAMAEAFAEEAFKYLEEVIANTDKNYKPGPLTKSESVERYSVSYYASLSNIYAQALALSGKYDKAVYYGKRASDVLGKEQPEIGERYIVYLSQAGDMTTLRSEAADMVRNGGATLRVKSLLREAYIKEKGSDAGYSDYLTSLEVVAKKHLHEKMLGEVAKLKVDQPANNFSLSDVNGKIISLAALKGKIVVLDFWATWCGPCKGSFPAMKTAVEQYKADTNVVFLFVNTAEPGGTTERISKIDKFMTDNHYPFHVILDTAIKAGSLDFAMGNSYGVTGIPTKVVLDGKGILRFKESGGLDESELLEELSIMIDAAKS